MFDPLFLKSGDTLPGGKYLLVQALGRGSMGVVFWAKDQHLHRDVALKFLSDRARTVPGVKARFLREARALARIQNAHVVQVYEVSPDDADELFIAMEYLVGADLAARLEAAFRPSAEEAVRLGLQACEALAAAHAQGIVHRDLKPSNLIVSAEGMLKVVDFGVSRVLNEPRLTRTGEAVGTPYYMSPEQIRSEREVDHRSDIWSLGVILYELLSGKKPFEGRNIGEVMHSIQFETPRTLSSRGVRMPVALDQVIQRCLEKDREKRFNDAADLKRALERCAAGNASSSTEWPGTVTQPLAPTPPPSAETSVPRSSGRGLYALAGALVGALLVTGLVLVVGRSRSTPVTTVRAATATPPSANSVVAAPVAVSTVAPPLPTPSASVLASAAPQVIVAPTPSAKTSVSPRPSAHPHEATATKPEASAEKEAPQQEPSSKAWLPEQPVGAAVSPYQDTP